MVMCSCLSCQKWSGTGHSTIAMVRDKDVQVTGELAGFARRSDSGAIMTQSFCPACGTPIHGRSSRADKVLLLPVGLFGPNSEWFRPNQLIFATTHHEWDVISPDLPGYAAYRDTASKPQ